MHEVRGRIGVEVPEMKEWINAPFIPFSGPVNMQWQLISIIIICSD